MKKIIFIFILFSCFCFQAEESEDLQMCEHAKRLNTVKAWVDYLLEFPKGECAEEAKMAIENAEGKNDEPESEEQKAANEEKRKEEEKAARIEETRRKMEQQILKAEEERVAAELRAKQEAEARKEAELKAKQEAAARREAELKAQREAEAARREAELQAQREAAARREAELKAQREAEAARIEAERKAMKERKAKVGGNLYWSERSFPVGWYQAISYCSNLREGGYSDWRLPNIDELRMLIKNCSKTVTGGSCRVSQQNKCLSTKCWKEPTRSCYCEVKQNNDGYYSKLGDDGMVALWSNTSASDIVNLAWLITFVDAGVVTYQTSNVYFARCVR
jgi:hypothetical protein